MKKSVYALGIIILVMIAGLSGCVENSKDGDKNGNSSNSNKAKIAGTWISPDIYGKEYYIISMFNSDGTFESYIVHTYDYQSTGTWNLINDTRFHMHLTETTNGKTVTSSSDYDYAFINDDTLIYGNKSMGSPGNAIQFYRLDGRFQIIFKFKASPSTIDKGSEVNLSWVVIGGSSFSINNGIGNVERIGYTKIYPDETIEYILTVREGEETYTANTTITVIDEANDEPDENEYPIATIDTTKGVMKVKLFDTKLPITVNNFITLANEGFYDGLIFHRIMNDFMIQAGWMYPNETKVESPYGNIVFESHEDVRHVDGAISMASTGAAVGGSSQFFICDGAQSFLDDNYATFGVVIEGLDVLRDIADDPHDNSSPAGGGKPYTDIIINSIIIEYS